MLAIADARFVDRLAAEAVRAGKLPRDFRVPDAWRDNTPDALRARLQPFAARGLLPSFPFGSDFTPVEQRLMPALLWLKKQLGGVRGWTRLAGAAIAPGRTPDTDVCLQRLALNDDALSWRERLLARVVRGALARTTRST
jgi:hypothetical protein